MQNRLNQWRADVRFWLWKARTVHAQRYISLLTIVVTVAGLAFYAYQNPERFINKVKAVASAELTANTLTISGSNSKYLLLPNDNGTPSSCLWPLNVMSAQNITNLGVANFKGKVCFTTSNLALTVDGGNLNNRGNLSIVGPSTTTFSTVTVLNDGVITTAPADGAGKAVPYKSRAERFATRFTGFVKLSGNIPQTRTYCARIPDGWGDDAAVIKTGERPNVNLNTDPNPFDRADYSFNNANESNPDKVHSSFRRVSNGGVLADGNERQYFAIGIVNPGADFYLPISISNWEWDGDSDVRVQWKEVNSGIGDCSPAAVAGTPLYLPTQLLFAPFESGPNVGLADTGTPGRMRFEYGTDSVGSSTQVSQGGTPVSADLLNANEYAFFSRVDVTDTGTFNGFGKWRLADDPGMGVDAFAFRYPDGGGASPTVGNPLSNIDSDSKLGYGYRIGQSRDASGNPVEKPWIAHNYKLFDHNESDTTGINAGLLLATSGDMSLISGASINVEGKGLPGGWSDINSGNSEGSGVGGRARTGGIGYIKAFGGDCGPSTHGSSWDTHGGGAGSAGKCISPGVGGGGGGVAGFGSAGRLVDANENIAFDPGDKYLSGPGGGGYRGLGGGLGTAWTNPLPYAEIKFYDTGRDRAIPWDGTSNRGEYSSAVETGMGGGGSRGTEGDGGNLGHPSEGGSGGGLIKLTVRNISVNNSTINANGESKANAGSGGGGGGTISITTTGQFTFENNSFMTANGGGTARDTALIDGRGYGKAGQGGGGLIKVRTPSVSDYVGDGWPQGTVLCETGAEFRDRQGNLRVKAGTDQFGSEPSATIKTYAEQGIIDLQLTGNLPFCGAGAAVSADVQTSKIIQQVKNQSLNFIDLASWQTNIAEESNWSNVSTVVPGQNNRLRIVITVQNPTDQVQSVTVTDKLPINAMVIDQGKVMRLDGTLPDEEFNVAPNNGSFTFSDSTVPAGQPVRYVYTVNIPNPFQ